MLGPGDTARAVQRRHHRGREPGRAAVRGDRARALPRGARRRVTGELAPAILRAVEAHARDSRFTDDLTVLILKRAAAVRRAAIRPTVAPQRGLRFRCLMTCIPMASPPIAVLRVLVVLCAGCWPPRRSPPGAQPAARTASTGSCDAIERAVEAATPTRSARSRARTSTPAQLSRVRPGHDVAAASRARRSRSAIARRSTSGASACCSRRSPSAAREGRVATWRLDVEPAAATADGTVADRRRSNGSRSSAGCSASRSTRRPSTRCTTSSISAPGSDADAAVGHGVRRRRRPTGRRRSCCSDAGRVRVHAEAGGGARAGPHLLGQPTRSKPEFDAVFVRVNPREFDARVATERARRRDRSTRPTCAARTQVFDDLRAEELPDRSQRPEHRRAGRSCRRPTTSSPRSSPAVRRADLRARRARSPRTSPSSIAAATATSRSIRRRRSSTDARPLLQRGRRLDYDVLATTSTRRSRRTAVGRRHARSSRSSTRAPVLSTLTLRLAELAGRPQRHLAAVRPAAAPARRRPEQRARRLAGDGRRADTELELTSPTAGGCRRRRIDREAHRAFAGTARQRRSDRAFRWSRSSSTATAATGIRRRTVTDYATAELTITVPAEFDVVASGDAQWAADAVDRRRRDSAAAQEFVFDAAQPDALPRVHHQPLPGRRRATHADSCRDDDRPRSALHVAGEPAAGVDARARDSARRRPSRHPEVLRVADRRRAVPQLHARADRERPARRPQPGVLRDAQSAAADVAVRRGATIRWRSRTTRRSSSRTSSRTSGGARRSAGRTTTSSGSARGSRSTSPRCTPSASAGREQFARRAAADAALGHRRRRRRGRCISAIASATSRRTAASSARSSTTRARWCCTCCGA